MILYISFFVILGFSFVSRYIPRMPLICIWFYSPLILSNYLSFYGLLLASCTVCVFGSMATSTVLTDRQNPLISPQWSLYIAFLYCLMPLKNTVLAVDLLNYVLNQVVYTHTVLYYIDTINEKKHCMSCNAFLFGESS